MTRQIKVLSSFILVIASFTTSAYAANVSQTDTEVANKLASGSAAEVQMGRLAHDRASNPAVRDFGDRMSKDHSALISQVKKWASQNDVSVSSQIHSADRTHIDELAKLSGKDFDRRYIEMMLKDHQKDIAEVQDFVSSGEQSSFKDLAKTSLPVLENHLRIAENIAGQIGVSPQLGLNMPEHPKNA